MNTFQKNMTPALLAALFCAAWSFGDDQPANDALAVMKAKYEAGLQMIAADCTRQKTDAFAAYGRNLNEKLQAMKQAGDFDGYLAVEKAKKEYVQNIVVLENANAKTPALREVAGLYHKTVEKADADQAKKTGALQDRYMAVLQDAVKKLTTQDKLEDAKKFADELAAIRASRVPDIPPAATASPESTAKPATTPATFPTSDPVKPVQAERTGGAPSAAQNSGHFGKPATHITKTYKMKGSGTFEVWKQAGLVVKSGEWVAVKITTATKNSMLVLQRSDQKTTYRDPVVFVKSKGGSCASTVAHGEFLVGVFRATEDDELSYACTGDADVVAVLTITSSDPREDVWIPGAGAS